MVAMNINTDTYALSVSTTSAAITFNGPDTNSTSLIIYNDGSTAVFVVCGPASPTAVFPTSATIPLQGKVIGPGQTVTYTKKDTDAFLSAIRLTGTGSIYVSVGAGE